MLWPHAYVTLLVMLMEAQIQHSLTSVVSSIILLVSVEKARSVVQGMRYEYGNSRRMTNRADKLAFIQIPERRKMTWGRQKHRVEQQSAVTAHRNRFTREAAGR